MQTTFRGLYTAYEAPLLAEENSTPVISKPQYVEQFFISRDSLR